MLVSTHMIISFLIALFLYPLVGLYSIVFFLAGFLIDFDHCIEYTWSSGDFNPFNAYKKLIKDCKENKKRLKSGKRIIVYRRYLHVFHTIEFVIFLGIASFFSKIMFFVFLGVSTHILLDLIAFLAVKIRAGDKYPGLCREHFATVFLIKNYFRHNK